METGCGGLVVFLARCVGVWLGLAGLCEADEVEAVVGTDGGALVMPELVGDPTLQETMISSIGSAHGVFTTQPSIHRRVERTRVARTAPQCCRLR